MPLPHEHDGTVERPLESKVNTNTWTVMHDWTRCENCDSLVRAGGCGNSGCPLLHWCPTSEQVAEAKRRYGGDPTP